MTSRYFTAFCLLSTAEAVPPRVGFTLPRALGKAVKRNRIRRRLREAVRSQLGLLPDAWAIVFNPKRSLTDADFGDLRQEVARVFSKCRLF